MRTSKRVTDGQSPVATAPGKETQGANWVQNKARLKESRRGKGRERPRWPGVIGEKRRRARGGVDADCRCGLWMRTCGGCQSARCRCRWLVLALASSLCSPLLSSALSKSPGPTKQAFNPEGCQHSASIQPEGRQHAASATPTIASQWAPGMGARRLAVLGLAGGCFAPTNSQLIAH